MRCHHNFRFLLREKIKGIIFLYIFFCSSDSAWHTFILKVFHIKFFIKLFKIHIHIVYFEKVFIKQKLIRIAYDRKRVIRCLFCLFGSGTVINDEKMIMNISMSYLYGIQIVFYENMFENILVLVIKDSSWEMSKVLGEMSLVCEFHLSNVTCLFSYLRVKYLSILKVKFLYHFLRKRKKKS